MPFQSRRAPPPRMVRIPSWSSTALSWILSLSSFIQTELKIRRLHRLTQIFLQKRREACFQFCDLTDLSLPAARSAEFDVSRTCHKMVIHHANGLHQRVADR